MKKNRKVAVGLLFFGVIFSLNSFPLFASSTKSTVISQGWWGHQSYLDSKAPAPQYNASQYIDGHCEPYNSSGGWNGYPADAVCGPAGYQINTSTCPSGSTALPGDHCACSDGSTSVTTGSSETCPGVTPNDDNPDPCNGSGSAGNPIITRNGNKSAYELDYSEHADFPLTLERSYYYHSNNHVGNWTFGNMLILSMRIDTGNVAVDPESSLVRHFTLHKADGSVYQFYGNNVSGYKMSTADTGETLSAWLVAGVQQGWQITERDGGAQYFNLGITSADVTSMQLVKLEQMNGLSHSFAYATNQVTETNDVTGNSIVWNYSGGNVTSAVVSGIGTFIYGYVNGMLATMTDPDAQIRRYWYENGDYPQALTGISDENGTRYKTYAYDAYGRAAYSGLGSAASGGPDSVSVTYAALTNWTSATISNAVGQQATYIFSPVGNNRQNKVTRVQGQAASSCLASNTDYTYDPNGYRNTETDSKGVVTYTVHDPHGRIIVKISGERWTNDVIGSTLVEQPESQQVQTVYYGSTLLPLHRRYFGRTSSNTAWQKYRTEDFVYGSNNRLTQRVVTDNLNNIARTWNYTNTYYSGTAVLQELKVKDPLNNVTTYSYNSSGKLTSVASPTINNVTKTTTYADYTSFGLPQTITDVNNNVVTTLIYDTRGRLHTSTTDSKTTTIDYRPNGLVQHVIAPDNTYFSYTYNDAHQLTDLAQRKMAGATPDDAADALIGKIHYAPSVLNGQWLDATTTDSNNQTVLAQHREFDALGRLWHINDADNLQTKTVLGYDQNDNLTNIIQLGDATNNVAYDDKNRVVYRTHDGQNRISSESRCVDDGAPIVPNLCSVAGVVITQYTHDNQGNIASVKDANNHTTTYTYNGFGELATQVSPDSGTTKYIYDAAGNIKTKTKGYGTATAQIITYSWDALNRLTNIDYPPAGASAQDVAYTYDDHDDGIHGKGVGRLTHVADASGATDYQYNALGHVTQKTFLPAGEALPQITAYDYNSSTGHLDNVTYPSGEIIHLDRDASTQQIASLSDNGSAIISSVIHQAFGGITSWHTASDGLINQYQRNFDTDGRLNSWGYAATGANAAVIHQLDYDAYNNINADHYLTGTIGSSKEDPSRRESYSYDTLNRLNQVTAEYGQLGYGYDNAGNRSSKTFANLQPDPMNPGQQVMTAVYNEEYAIDSSSNRINSIKRYQGSTKTTTLRERALHYDARGNLHEDIRTPYSGGTAGTSKTYTLNHGNSDRLDGITAPVAP